MSFKLTISYLGIYLIDMPAPVCEHTCSRVIKKSLCNIVCGSQTLKLTEWSTSWGRLVEYILKHPFMGCYEAIKK